jgi:hypothetical protein
VIFSLKASTIVISGHSEVVSQVMMLPKTMKFICSQTATEYIPAKVFAVRATKRMECSISLLKNSGLTILTMR